MSRLRVILGCIHDNEGDWPLLTACRTVPPLLSNLINGPHCTCVINIAKLGF